MGQPIFIQVHTSYNEGYQRLTVKVLIVVVVVVVIILVYPVVWIILVLTLVMKPILGSYFL